MAKERNSIIELFRLFSMWCVVAHHFVIHNGSPVSVFVNPVTRAFYNVVFLPIGKVAVGCFGFVSDWFIAGSSSFSVKHAAKKLLSLNNEVVFYSIILGGIALISGYTQPSVSLLIKILFPIATGYGWWFVTSYAGLLLLLPFLMKGLRACSKDEHRLLAYGLTIAFGFFRYLPFVSFPAAGGLIDFVVIAIDICYLRWHIALDNIKMSNLLSVLLFCAVFGAATYYLPYHSQGIVRDFAANLFVGYRGSSASVLSIGISASLSLAVFKFARRRQWTSSLINFVASSAFAVYLISDYEFVRVWLWKSVFTFDHLGAHMGMLYVVLIPSVVMIACLLIDLSRRVAVNQFSKRVLSKETASQV